MKRKKPVRGAKLNPLLFRCPYCGEDNISKPRSIRSSWREDVARIAEEEIIIEYGVPKRVSLRI